MNTYLSDYQLSIEKPTVFWEKQARNIDWFTFPKNILSPDHKGYPAWFEGGSLNMAYLCLDYHIENGRGNQPALIYDSPVTNTTLTYTYAELQDKVARFAGAMQKNGVQKGDRIVIYMPMIPEAVIAMLASARIGAIHSVVFGGFAPHELAIRIDDARPKLIISASCGIEFDRIIPYKPLLDQALEESAWKPQNVIFFQREIFRAEAGGELEIDFMDFMNQAEAVAPVPVEAWDPLYILYTSGTTGKPKGIVRDTGGYAVALKYSMDKVYNTKAGEVYWAASDIGWVVGHSYIVYGPLIQGCTTILFEGKPIRTPDAGTFWRVVSEHKVANLFTAPTAIRAIRKEDPDGEFIRKYNLSCLRNLFLAGERCDPPTLEWAQEQLNIPVLDHWWQTETGWAMVANMTGYELFPVKPGSASLPVCGYNIKILSEEGKELIPNQEGYITVKLPLPPGCLPTLWNEDRRFYESYLNQYPGYYLTGDGGYKDEEGYIFIMGRIDDVINVSGHRLSTGEMEEIVGGHDAVAECAVIGIEEKIKGQVPLGLVVLKSNVSVTEELLEKEIVALIRNKIGALASFRQVVVVKRLPKTRSGKILRKTMQKIADGVHYAIPSTIDDPVILTEIHDRLKERKIGNAFEY
ncbi:MAG: propionyl-CoA synthetase [Bacteroidia bacterium]|nr:propionyl-CoA synthetase [Bacteroidia bacterium]